MPKEMTRYTMTKSPVIMLRSSEDWTEWLDHIQKAATLFGVREYCDPALEQEDLPDLKEPRPPSKIFYSPEDLDEKGIEALKAQVIKYRKDLAEFDEKLDALDKIEELIQASVSDACWAKITGKGHEPFVETWNTLRTLSDVFGRPSKKKMMELEDQWDRLRDLAEKPLVQEYIRGWDSLFKQCVDLRIVQSSSKRIRDTILLNAMMELTSGSEIREHLAFQPWIEMPDSGWPQGDDGDDDQTEKDDGWKDDGYWDYLSSADADTPDDTTTDDQGQSRPSSPGIGWQVPVEAKW